ncbi:MAG TPA: DUF3300 domain-containing protein [Opitutaceae bacterium]|nr:DUF3300 domain-containing protein [Opitutaceae bacterium]
MKTRILATLLIATLTPWAAAETVPDIGDSTAPIVSEQGQLEILMAPIALYPDALVALILPASTHPSEIVLASRFLSGGGKEEEIDAQIWDDSVKGLARFPEVVTFLDENLEWTQDVGDAFVANPAEVMSAIQALRARGARNGTLATTPQQEVVFEDDSTIRIVPAEPTVIYVPYYEPSILYPSYSYGYSYFPSSLVWFGVGYGIGSWLSYDCNWRYRTIYVHHHHRSHWGRDHDWRRRYNRDWNSHVGGDGWSRWAPSNNYRRSRPRGDRDYARTDFRTTTRDRFDRDRSRYESRQGSGSSTTFNRDNTSRTGTSDSRSIRRPDTLRTPSRIDRSNDSGRTADIRRDRTPGDRTDRTADIRRERRPSDNVNRYTDRTPTESVSTPRREPSAQDLRRRNDAPVRRNPEAGQRRSDSVDRRPEVARIAPTARRDTPRPAATPPASRPAPQPARTITSGSQLRQPQSARVANPSPSPARQVSRPAPAPAQARASSPSPEPSRQASYSAPRSDSSRSSQQQSGGSGRQGRADRNEN